MIHLVLLLAALFFAIVLTTAHFALGGVLACVSPGRGRHRRAPQRGRHAARGGVR